MTAVIDGRAYAAAPLAPVTATLRPMFGTDDLPGLAPGLLVEDEQGWLPATELITGDRLPELLTAAQRSLAGHPARRRRAALEGLHLLAGAAGRARLGLGPPGAAAAGDGRAGALRRRNGRC